jgi:hypothetical protein
VTLSAFGGVADAVKFDLLRFDGAEEPEAVGILDCEAIAGEATEVITDGPGLDT